jgi:hypothetical protein
VDSDESVRCIENDDDSVHDHDDYVLHDTGIGGGVVTDTVFLWDNMGSYSGQR